MSGSLLIGVVGISVLLVVLVPLVKQVCAAAALAAIQEAANDNRGIPGRDAAHHIAYRTEPAPAIPSDNTADTIDLARVEGRVQASAVRKVSEIVDRHPEEALSIVRAWMVQDS
jgi:flagellar M-ring protein FliF